MKIDSDYWMNDIELKQFRGRLILTTLELMDKKFQEDHWVDKNLDPMAKYFAEEIFLIGEEFFDDLLKYDYHSSKEELLENLSYMLKDGELEPLLKIYNPLEVLFFDYQYDHEFMSCPELPMVRQRSLEAFKVFLENEKDNGNFCEYVLAYAIRIQNRVKEGECEGVGYEFVKNYIKIVEQRGFESTIKYDLEVSE